MAEVLQQLVLTTLDEQGSIADTRALVLPGQAQPATANEDQIVILGALNSLLSRDVCVCSRKQCPKLTKYVDD